MKKKPAHFTELEVRKILYRNMLASVRYWIDKGRSREETTNGIVFSMLNLFDGTTMELPAMNISMEPHPDDEAYCIKLGERWFKPGMIINSDTEMHSEFCSLEDQL